MCYTVFYIWNGTATDRFTVLADFIATLASALTTVTATLLIALKIVIVTRKSSMHHSYAKVIEIIVESGALVSTIMLAEALLELVSFLQPFDLATKSGQILVQLAEYVSSFQTWIVVCCTPAFFIHD